METPPRQRPQQQIPPPINPRSKKKRKRGRGVHHPRTLNFDEVADTLEQKIKQLILTSGQQQQKVDMLQNELKDLKTLRENEKLEQDKKFAALFKLAAALEIQYDVNFALYGPALRASSSEEDSDSGEEDSDSEGSDVRERVRRRIYPGSSSYQTSLKY